MTVLDDEALPRLRAGQRPVVPAVVRRDGGAQCAAGRSRTRCSPTCASERPTVFFSVPALYGALVARRRRPTDAFDSRADVRLGRRGAVAGDLRALAGALRPRDRRRHRLDRDAPHLLLERARARSCRARPGARSRATSCGSSTRTGSVLDGRRRSATSRCAATAARRSTGTSTRRRSAACEGDWFSTGDRYRRTDDGAYVYEGRADDMLKIGGLWVSPDRHGERAHGAPARDGVGVVGVTVDEVSRVAAYVIRATATRPTTSSPDELRALCKERLRRYEYPHVVRVRGRPAADADRQGPALPAARADGVEPGVRLAGDREIEVLDLEGDPDAAGPRPPARGARLGRAVARGSRRRSRRRRAGASSRSRGSATAGRSRPPHRGPRRSSTRRRSTSSPPCSKGLDAPEPILVGHSDGGSIALVHAAHRPVTAVVLVAPHVVVEEMTLAAIRRTREAYARTACGSAWPATTTTPMPRSGWCDVWLDPAFPRVEHRGRGRRGHRAAAARPGRRRPLRHARPDRPHRVAGARRDAAPGRARRPQPAPGAPRRRRGAHRRVRGRPARTRSRSTTRGD